jgi:hypothetical protein
MTGAVAQALVGYSFNEGVPQNQTQGTGQIAFAPDGTCTFVNGTGPTPANWYSVAPQPGIGANYWFFIVAKTGGSGFICSNFGVAQNMAVGTPTVLGTGAGTLTYTYKICSDQAGTQTVATGTNSYSDIG